MAQTPGTEVGTPDGTYHYIMSLSWGTGRGPAQGTFAGAYTAAEDDTEDSAYQRIYEATRERYDIRGNATVLFYRLTRNALS